jgi:hypothetical protein
VLPNLYKNAPDGITKGPTVIETTEKNKNDCMDSPAMKQALLVILAILTVFLMGCSNQFSTYDAGLAEMKRVQQKYGADFEKAPILDAIPSLASELQAFERKIVPNEDTKALSLLVDYRIKVLESDRLLLEGFKWEDASTTEKGFGCRKGSERILNSSALRIMAVSKGMDSIGPLRKFIEEYPERASAINLSQRSVLSLTTTYSVVEKQAKDDKATVEGFCKDSISIEQQEDGLYRVTVTDESEDA